MFTKHESFHPCLPDAEAYFRSHQIRKLQVGSGINVLEDWFNTDVQPSCPQILFLDATQPFPFRDAVFDYVFSEHQIEHITYGTGLFMLQECYRVLRTDGKIRIATPSLETLLELYTLEKNYLQQRFIKFITDMCMPDVDVYEALFVINNNFRNWGHQFIYDRTTLQKAMEKTGFIDITFHMPGESDDENLRGIETHGKVIGNEEMNRFETMVLEGRHP